MILKTSSAKVERPKANGRVSKQANNLFSSNKPLIGWLLWNSNPGANEVATKWQQSGNQMSNFMFATRTRESIKSVVHSAVLLFLISIFCRHLQLFFLSLCIVDEYCPVLRVSNYKQWDQLFICDFRWLKMLPIGTNIVSREWLNTV